MPLHKRRTILVKIDSSGGNRIFSVGTVWKFTAALKNCAPTIYFDHGLQQKLHNFWVEITADQYFGSGTYKRHVNGRNVIVNINYSARQLQPNEFWEYNGESLRRRKTHEPYVRICQQGVDGGRVRRAEYPH